MNPWAVCATIALVMAAGCSSRGDSPPSVAPAPPGEAATGPPAPNHPAYSLRSGLGERFHYLEFSGTLAAGEGVWVTWPYVEFRDNASASHAVEVNAADPALLLPPNILYAFDDGTWNLSGTESFPFHFVSGTEGGWWGSGSSVSHFAALGFAIVAQSETTFRYNVTTSKWTPHAAPVMQTFRANWTRLGPFDAGEAQFSMTVQNNGWTHVHREPWCGLPASQDDLVSARVEFPNGFTGRAGPYMNGIFPGPTVDDAVYFGTFGGKAGLLQGEVTAPLPECIHILDTDLHLPWAARDASGYSNRWWRQEPLAELPA